MQDSSTMRIRFLGTATSQGIPIIACSCPTCISTDPRDKRLRVAVLIEYQDQRLLIDIGPDFREQMLREKVQRIDQILLTHEHRDHIGGLDDVRPLNFKYEMDMPVYALERVNNSLRSMYPYIFTGNYPGKPRVILEDISKEQNFTLGALHIQPIEVLHGSLPILGYRIGNFAYLTDVKYIRDEEKEKLKGLDILVCDALQHEEHRTHMNLTEALALVEELQPKRSYFTHISHNMGPHHITEASLPDNVHLAYDGLCLEVAYKK